MQVAIKIGSDNPNTIRQFMRRLTAYDENVFINILKHENLWVGDINPSLNPIKAFKKIKITFGNKVLLWNLKQKWPIPFSVLLKKFGKDKYEVVADLLLKLGVDVSND